MHYGGFYGFNKLELKKKLDKVTEIELSWDTCSAPINLANAKIFAEVMKNKKNLISLCIRGGTCNCNRGDCHCSNERLMCDDGVKAFVEIIKNNKQLTHISFERCGITSLGIQYLIEAIKNKKYFISLNLAGNRFGDKGVKIVTQALKKKVIFLVALNISYCNIGAKGLVELSLMLKNNNTLVFLDLSDNEAIKNSHYVTRSSSEKALVEALKLNKCLIHLRAGRQTLCDMGNDGGGLYEMPFALEKNNVLTRLDLEGSFYTNDAFDRFIFSLKKNTSLYYLLLGRGNQDRGYGKNPKKRDVTGVKKVVSAFKHNTTLVCIDFLYSTQGPKPRDIFCEGMEKIGSRNKKPYNQLNEAIKKGDIDKIKSLLTIIRAFHVSGDQWDNVLHTAVKYKQKAIIEFFLTKYFLHYPYKIYFLHEKNKEGFTPIKLAKMRTSAEFSRWFLKFCQKNIVESRIQFFASAYNTGEINFFKRDENKSEQAKTQEKAVKKTLFASMEFHQPKTKKTCTNSKITESFQKISQDSEKNIDETKIIKPNAPSITPSKVQYFQNIQEHSKDNEMENITPNAPTLTESKVQYFQKVNINSLPQKGISESEQNESKETKIKTSFIISFNELKINSENQLGAGGFGVVYKGSWQNMTVAIKQLHVCTMTEKTLSAFQKESEMMYSLRHPHILPLYGICMDKGHYCMVLKYMPNGSLYNFLHSSKFKFSSWLQKWEIAIGISKGLLLLHSKNILHRDLSSHNILLSKNLKAKISDFGLSIVKQETKTLQYINQSSQAVGKIAWMAPELFKPGCKYIKACDIYSLGMIFWEMVLGKVPFANAKMPLLIMQWVTAGVRETIPEKKCSIKYSSLIKLCWHHNPKKRPTIEKVVEILQKNKHEIINNSFSIEEEKTNNNCIIS